MRVHSVHAVLVACMAANVLVPMVAGATNDDRFHRWWTETLELVRAERVIDRPIEMAFTNRALGRPSDTELAQLRERVKNKPQHPERATAAFWEEERKVAAEVRYTLWHDGDRLRLNVDHVGVRTGFEDYALAGAASWSHNSKRAMALLDARRPPSGLDVRQVGSVEFRRAKRFIVGGLADTVHLMCCGTNHDSMAPSGRPAEPRRLAKAPP